MAIYLDEQVVGFSMYGSFGPTDKTWIDRLLIDEAYQGQGIGKRAMTQLISQVFETYPVETIYLSIVKTNTVAYRFYTQLGFMDLKEIDPSNGELMFAYQKSREVN